VVPCSSSPRPKRCPKARKPPTDAGACRSVIFRRLRSLMTTWTEATSLATRPINLASVTSAGLGPPPYARLADRACPPRGSSAGLQPPCPCADDPVGASHRQNCPVAVICAKTPRAVLPLPAAMSAIRVIGASRVAAARASTSGGSPRREATTAPANVHATRTAPPRASQRVPLRIISASLPHQTEQLP